MKNTTFKNYSLNRDSKNILSNGGEFKKGNVSGNSIEYMEGNSFCSITYYEDVDSRDEDLKKIEEILSNGLDN